MASDKTMDGLDLTNDEVKRLGEALKNEQFRKMLVEYAEEISDPENKRKAEEEIRMMENERGMDVEFIHPKPGHVLKTIVDGTTKAFINICQNDKIDKPSSKRQTGPDGKNGLMWHIPHSFAPPKDDVDKAKGKCKVFDVVFNPDTYRMAQNNERFRKLVEDTAIEGIERQFSVTIDKKNIKHPKMSFKGQPVATVIRERKSNAKDVKSDADSILGKMPYPYDNKTSSEKAATKEEKISKEKNKSQSNGVNGKQKEESQFTVPKYTITHRSKVDMSEYRNAPDAKTSTRPNELVIKIELPLLKSATQLNLDIFEKRIVLESTVPAAYKLDLSLPFPVNDDEGSAKFDKSKHSLTVTLPVIPEKVPELPFSHKGDGDSLQNGDEISNSDLITVLQDTSNIELSEDSSKLQESNNLKNSEKTPLKSNEKLSLPKDVKWLMPEYQVSQDSQTVSFVIKVNSVEEKSVSMNFKENTGVRIQFMSLGAGCFPSYYSMSMDFGETMRISPKDCSVDVSDDNLVMLILKDKNCRELWDSYNIGLDMDSLEAKQFLTESNLKRDLCALDEESEKEATMPNQQADLYNLSVLEMSAEKLTVEIKPKEKSGEEEEESDPVSPGSIEVVHRHPTPPLHSILKQRTVSESSEDCSLTASCTAIDSMKSVSFNKRIDQASFKSNASVSSMTPTLKNKRKKQRQRDMKQNKAERRRVRKLSGGSGTSSGEDSQTRESFSDSHSITDEEEDGDGEDKGKPFRRSTSDPGPTGGNSTAEEEVIEEEEEEVSAQNKDGVIEVSTESSDVIQDDSKVLDFRTKQCDNKDSEDNVNVESESVQEKSSVRWNEKVTKEIKDKLAATKDGDKNKRDEGHRDSDDEEEDGDGENGVDCHNDGSNGRKGDGDAGKRTEDERENVKERSDVETSLSWEDGPSLNGTEHQTRCAFQFNNTVMYDLDVD